MSPSTPIKPDTVLSKIEAQQTALGISDSELCAAIGFDRDITLTLIKTRSMRLPLNKIPAFANALNLDAGDLLTAALLEYSPDLAGLIATVFDPMKLTDPEKQLINRLRMPPETPLDEPSKQVDTLGTPS